MGENALTKEEINALLAGIEDENNNEKTYNIHDIKIVMLMYGEYGKIYYFRKETG